MTGIDIDLNAEVNEENELNLSDTVPIPENTDVPIRKRGRPPKKKGNKKSKSKKEVDGNADADMGTIIPKRKRGRPPKERREGSTVEKNVRVVTDVRKGDDVDGAGEEKNEGAMVDIATSLSEKETENGLDNSEHVECGDDAAVRPPLKGKKTSISKKEVDVNADADMSTIAPKRKRGRLPKEQREGSTVEKNSRVVTDVKKGDGVDGSGEAVKNEEAMVDIATSLSEKETENGLDNSEHVECGDDASVRSPKNKEEKTSTVEKKVRFVTDVKKGDDVDGAGEEAMVHIATSLSEKETGNEPDYSEHMECGDDAAVRPLKKEKKKTSRSEKGVDVNADGEMDTIMPKRKRGRPPKGKREGSTVEKKVRFIVDVKKCDDVLNAGEEEKNEEAMVDTANSLLTKEAGDGLDNSEHMESGDDAAVSAHGDKSKGRRGRKRKTAGSSVHESDNDCGLRKKKTTETPLDSEIEVVGRVLRSRAVVLTSDKGDKKKKKMKGLRGRPRKVHVQFGTSMMIGCKKQIKHASRSKGVESLPGNDAKTSQVEDIAELRKECSSSDGVDMKIVRKELNTEKLKEEEANDMGKRTRKQLIKDRLKDMLLNAGWKIDYRPRNGKANHCDAVYMSPKGRGYWSITLAYKIHKQEVESGEADSRAVSAFVPIPEDEWNCLLRTATKKGVKSSKGKKVKDQTGNVGNVISQKKILIKKHAKKNDRLRGKQKEALKGSKGKEKKKKKRLTLLARCSKKGGSEIDDKDFLLYNGNRSLLSWMIDLGTVPLGVKVKCMDSGWTKALLQGKVTEGGKVHCDCCDKSFALADFEFHSGSSLGQPLQSMCLDSNISLLQCLSDSWIKYRKTVPLGFHSHNVEGDDPNDDTCNKCGDGGNLICCDSCPSAIHQKCLDIQEFPSGEWNCVYCSCKFCGMVSESTLDEDLVCDESSPTLLTCRLCEEKFHHPLCVQGKDTSNNGPTYPTFCGQKCQEIFHQLHLLLGVKHQMEEGFTWTLIQHSDDNLDISSLSGAKTIECNAKLAVAWSVMDECFLPIVDERSGINMIRNVVYSCGSNIRRLNYTGFFIAILERDDEMISAASLRIHGNQLAEMPFIGTRNTYRRQGMCRRLLDAIETALSSLNVEKLVLPAIPELQQTWTSVFGFMPLEDSHKKEMKYMNMIAFPGVAMLQKPVIKRLFNTDIKLGGTSDVATIGYPTSQVPNVFSDGSSDMTCELDAIVIDKDYSKKEDAIAPSENGSKLDNCHTSDESNRQENVPSESCNVASIGDFKLDEQKLAEAENRTKVSEDMSDPIDRETKPSSHSSDVKGIIDHVPNGEVNAIDHSIDHHAVNKCVTSTQALVLV